MITTGKELCPYFGEKEREEWHRKRGLGDPQKSAKGPARSLEASARDHVSRTSVCFERPPLATPKEEKEEPKDSDKHARYRARKKEELAAKARARRAKK
jgi:hypothetical protein